LTISYGKRGIWWEFDMVDRNIAYIRTEPITPSIPCEYVNGPNYRCTIELIDGSTIMRCGVTVLHALANAIACYKTTAKPKTWLAVNIDAAKPE
jgi:hypothetical protein